MKLDSYYEDLKAIDFEMIHCGICDKELGHLESYCEGSIICKNCYKQHFSSKVEH